MKFLSPIPNKFMEDGTICRITQFFNDNMLDYKQGYHGALDFRTRGSWWYRWHNQKNEWIALERTKQEKDGRIHLLASNDGTLKLRLYEDKERKGWGLFIESEPEVDKQYRTMYWHIETPWRGLGKFNGVIKSIVELVSLFAGKKVKAGSPVAIGGDNGYSTGPHLHFEIHERVKVDGLWGEWVKKNPILFLDDDDVVYKHIFGDIYWHKGKMLPKAQAIKKIEQIKKRFIAK